MKAVHSVPRPDSLTWICAGMLTLPTFVFYVGAAVLILVPSERGALDGPAGFGVIIFLIFTVPLLTAEYRAVIRRRPGAALAIAIFCLFPATVSMAVSVIGLLGVLGLNFGPDARPWGFFAFHTAFLAYFTTVGVGHLRWHRRLKSAGATDRLKPVLRAGPAKRIEEL